MNEDGYTLAEVLAALVIIGLTIGGLTAGMAVVGRMQKAAASGASEQVQRRGAERAFARLLAGEGPFRSDDAKPFRGEPKSFSFRCGGQETCNGELVREHGRMRLKLKGRGGWTYSTVFGDASEAVFAFADAAGVSDVWPPGRRDAPDTLQSVTIVQPKLEGDQPILSARVWAEQPVACQYDLVSMKCREEFAQ